MTESMRLWIELAKMIFLSSVIGLSLRAQTHQTNSQLSASVGLPVNVPGPVLFCFVLVCTLLLVLVGSCKNVLLYTASSKRFAYLPTGIVSHFLFISSQELNACVSAIGCSCFFGTGAGNEGLFNVMSGFARPFDEKHLNGDQPLSPR